MFAENGIGEGACTVGWSAGGVLVSPKVELNREDKTHVVVKPHFSPRTVLYIL